MKTTVPNYLSGLPIPDSFGGWFRLGGKQVTQNVFCILVVVFFSKLIDLNIDQPIRHALVLYFSSKKKTALFY